VIDFPGVESIPAQFPIEVNSCGVIRIRAGKPRPSISRIVFDLEDRVPLYRIREVEEGLEVSFWFEDFEEPEEKVERVQLPTEIPKKEKEPEKKPEKSEKDIKKEKRATKKEAEQKIDKIPEEKRFSLSVFGGAYFVQDEVFMEAYGKMNVFVGGEYSIIIPSKKETEDFDIGLIFKNFLAKGSTTYLEEELKLRMFHISMTIRYLKHLSDKYTIFIGPGMDYISYKEIYSGDFPAPHSMEGIKLGGHLQAGGYFHISKSLSLRAHFKYNIASEHKGDVKANLGGIEWGFGLSYYFDM
ncbi:MAG: outer membrane beta-barrel protein, partial [Candidatus Aminicenantaceae bacterium]